jgi:leucine dehydrogenase
MSALDRADEWGHEEVLVHRDPQSGLRCVIAIHDTRLGPAAGGTRMRVYPSLDEAATDALRLARAMTYKSAMAEMPFGGGKAVILGDPARDKTRALLAAYARVIDGLGGRFNTGCDLGMEERDMAVLSRLTRHVHYSPPGTRLDTADLAALGVFESIRAAAAVLGRALPGLHVAVQGLGNVGFHLARKLAAAGARLTVADLDAARVERAAAELGAAAVDSGAIYDVESDVFSPNAATGVLNDGTIPRLRCAAVVGGANEQLAEPRHGDALHARGILYAPDYVVNAGGLLSLVYDTEGADDDTVTARVRAIGPRLAALWEQARADGLPAHRMADRLAEARLASIGQKRAPR